MALEWKVFTVERESLTQDAQMPSGNENLRWVANSSTLIYGQSDAILVDVFLTIDQMEELIKSIRETGKNLTAVYLTHAHGDHIFGAKMIKDQFPRARIVSLPEVVKNVPKQYDKQYVDTFWEPKFPHKIPKEFIVPEAITRDELEIEGHKIFAENAGFSDTESTSYLFVPSAQLIVAGDTVYNGIHPYLAETTIATRQEWVANLDKMAALSPKYVVAGHKVPRNDDLAANIGETKQYLFDFERLNDETQTVLELYERMLALYPDRVNPGSLWGSAKAAKNAQNASTQ